MATAETTTTTPAADTCQSHGHHHAAGETCQSHAPSAPPAVTLVVTEKAANEVKRIIAEMREAGNLSDDTKPVYLRLRLVGGGCSGFQPKLDLDQNVNEKLDELFEFHGVPTVVDRRSLIYLDDAKVDFHDDLNQRGFSFVLPKAK